jgi:hypothetical protein
MRPTATHISVFHNRNDDILKELKHNPHWTIFINIKPTGFNISTEFNETVNKKFGKN